MDKKKINQVLLNEATEQDAIEVAQWLGEAEGQLAAADMIDADMEMMVPHFDTSAAAEPMRLKDKKVSGWWCVAAVMAMVLTLSVSAMVIIPRMHQPEVMMQTISANRGEQVQVVLQDGTHVYLNAGSSMSYPSRFTAKNRQVTLVGEAYFEVEKDKHRPFIVELSGAFIEVLGTKFNVQAYENEPLRVNLDDGHVVFHGAQQKTDVQPGEQVIYDRLTCQTTLCSNVDTHMASAWKEHRLEVCEMPMQELVTILERRYNVNIHVRDEQCYQYMYSLAASDNNLHTILKRMSYVSPIRYHYDEEKSYVQIRARQ